MRSSYIVYVQDTYNPSNPPDIFLIDDKDVFDILKASSEGDSISYETGQLLVQLKGFEGVDPDDPYEILNTLYEKFRVYKIPCPITLLGDMYIWHS